MSLCSRSISMGVAGWLCVTEGDDAIFPRVRGAERCRETPPAGHRGVAVIQAPEWAADYCPSTRTRAAARSPRATPLRSHPHTDPVGTPPL